MLHEGYSLQANVKVAGLLVEFPAETGPGLLTADGLAAVPAAVLDAGLESVQPWKAPNQAAVQRATVQHLTVQEEAKEVNRNRESNRNFMVKLRGVVSVGGNKGVGVRPNANG